MGDKFGFKIYDRKSPEYQSVEQRIRHFNEFVTPVREEFTIEQSARCMDCGVPFCHSGCPLGNLIPDFNDAVYKGKWKKAYDILISTNNFPEFTGRICPAPCEASCVLGINNDAVSIEFIEKEIIERAYKEGWVTAHTNIERTGKKVSIVGSGPAGLAAADQLNKAGHNVTVYERNTRAGGLLRYGIPDFKLNKKIIDRKIDILEQEGIEFVYNTEVGVDVSAINLMNKSDALILCGGSTIPRDLNIEGRELIGVYFAMEFLEKNNKRVAGDDIDFDNFDMSGKNVLVIGGGDTGSDCIGTSRRLGADTIVQIELLGKPSLDRTENTPWPLWPMTLKTSTSHEEGCEREWSIFTKRFLSQDGVNLSGVEVVEVHWEMDENGKSHMVEKMESSKIIPCDYAFLAIGFLHPQFKGVLEELNVDLDNKNNVKCDDYHTSVDGVFSAGDMRRGQSLVVWAITEGREVARSVDKYLVGNQSRLESNFRSALEM